MGDRTSLQEVARAAIAAGVYVETLDAAYDDFPPAVVVNAHGGPWLVYLDPDTVLGWVAYQAIMGDLDYSEIDGTGGWLGPSDLEADRVVANLLEADELPTDLYGREPRVSTKRTLARRVPTTQE
jgi:hypothetical protein